jgi:hypothetical protein
VDGNRNAYFGNDSCSETGLGSPSWTVDLGPEIYVTSVTITTRADGYWRGKNNVNIIVMNGAEETLCASDFLMHDGATTTYGCEMVKKGTRVKIQNGGQRRMSLCEVEVHGYPFDFYEYEGKRSAQVMIGCLQHRSKAPTSRFFAQTQHSLQDFLHMTS